MTPVSPTQDQIQSSVRQFLLAVLPLGVDVIVAVQNRVPEPQSPNFVIISPIRFERSDTNIDTYADVKFTGSVSPESVAFTGSIAPAPAQPNVMPSGVLTVTFATPGTVVAGGLLSGAGVLSGTRVLSQLSGTAGGNGTYAVNPSQQAPSTEISESYGLLDVSSLAFGMVLGGATLFGIGVSPGTTIQAQGTGTGGVGTYIVSPSQSVGSESLACGAKVLQQNAKCVVQIDFHSGDNTASDMAQAVSTILRDEAGVDLFAAQSPNYGVVPLYADDPKFIPFINENQQAEWRFVLDCYLQVNQVMSVPAQFADELAVTPQVV